MNSCCQQNGAQPVRRDFHKIPNDTFMRFFCKSKFHGKTDLGANICRKIALAVKFGVARHMGASF